MSEITDYLNSISYYSNNIKHILYKKVRNVEERRREDNKLVTIIR